MDLTVFINDFSDIKTIKTFEKLVEWSEIANKFNKLLIVQGGFAVDLAEGKITRKHDDLDLITLESDVNWFKERFEVDGYKIKHHPEHDANLSFCAYKYNFMVEDSIYIDVEGINIDDQVWDKGDGNKYVWPVKPNELSETVSFGSVMIKYLSPKLIYEFKKRQQNNGAEIREKEQQDFRVLEKILGSLHTSGV